MSRRGRTHLGRHTPVSAHESYCPTQGLLELTGLLSGPLSLKCGGDTERDHSARDNETAERSPKTKVRLGYDVRDDWIYKYM